MNRTYDFRGSSNLSFSHFTLSLLVKLVSRNVVSALQLIVSIHIYFWLIRSLVDATLTTFIVCGPLQFVLLIYRFSDRRSSQIRYAAFLMHGTGHAFECLGWPCPAKFFGFSRHQQRHFVSLRPETRNVATRVQSTELDLVDWSFCNLCALAVGHHCSGPALLSLVMLVSQKVFLIASALQSIASMHSFCLSKGALSRGGQGCHLFQDLCYLKLGKLKMISRLF